MILTALIASLFIVLPGRGDLVFVRCDLREVDGLPWMEGARPVHIESDWFMALMPDVPPEEFHWLLIDSAPVDLDRYRILYTAQYDGAIPPLPGEAVLKRESFLLIRLLEPETGPVEVPGIGFLRPLKLHHEAINVTEPDISRADTTMVDEIVSAVSQDSITALVEHLESYGTRYMTSPEYDACADWADTWIEAHGVSCQLQTFSYAGDSMSNVVAEIQGIENPDDIYIICGHLDSYCSNPATAPGADDNGSGSAAVMEAVRVMSPYSYRNTIRFILFAAEEAWMVGSEYYVNQAYQQGDNILGAINLDMVLYAPYLSDSAYIPYNDQSELLALAAGEMFAEYSPSITPRVTYDPSAPSDHASFWQYGYTAIEVAEASAEEIWSGYNPYYHQPNDLLANYMSSFPYGTDMIRASIGLFAMLADPVGPSSLEVEAPGSGRIEVYPNPCRTGSVSISRQDHPEGGADFLLLDLSGRMVASGELEENGLCQLDLPSLPSGVYSVVFLDSGAEPVRFVLTR